VIFYVIVFSAAAVLLVVAGLTMQSRNRRNSARDTGRDAGRAKADHRQRKAKRMQSRNARRKRG